MTDAASVHFHTTVQEADPLVADALASERARQQNQIELIASENIVSRAVLDALGHEITNKTLEGYPGNRFHGGGQFVDIAEQAAIDRAKQLFNCGYANVQPHSGTQANLAVFFLLLKPGEKVLSLDLAAGGHLSHGMKANLSGRWFDANNYSVNPQNEVIDLDEMERIAEEIRPKLLITGGSAYPRELDFERMSKIARKVGAHFLVDMAHVAGLVAGGVHPSPFPHADIVTCTTTKTLRGPRGGLILTNNEEWYKKLQAAVFPGVQGSLHSNVLAAKAICLGEALRDDFKLYARQVVKNAKVLAETLADRGVRIVSGGTDTHIILLDLSSKGLLGKQAETLLAKANITSNKNPIPGDSPRPPDWVGMRLGSSAATTRGLKEEEFRVLGHVIADLIDAETEGRTDEIVGTARAKIAELTEKFSVYGH